MTMEIPIITKDMPWSEKSKFASLVKSGKWQNNKSGRVVEVISRNGFTLTLQHANGKKTKKQDHYFIGDYSTFIETDKQ